VCGLAPHTTHIRLPTRIAAPAEAHRGHDRWCVLCVRCLLCSLIDLGDVPKLPKYTSPTITRPIKNHLAAYTEFAEAFASGKPADLRAALEKHSAAFSADHNLGLAKQCLSALMRRSIRTLTETYLTLSLAHIAEMVSPATTADVGPCVFRPRPPCSRRAFVLLRWRASAHAFLTSTASQRRSALPTLLLLRSKCAT
jgi:hypothetical protein